MFKLLGKGEKISIVVIVLFLISTMAFLTFVEPSITGFVPAAYAVKNVGVVVIKNQSYILSSNNSDPLSLSSVLISGKVVGKGQAKIFLESSDKKYLVYSSTGQTGMESVTGFAIKENGKLMDKEMDFVPETEQNILPEFEDEEDLYTEEIQAFIGLLKKEIPQNKKEVLIDFIQNTEGVEFENECMETCSLFGLKGNKFRFDFEVDPGTIVLLNGITYSFEKD